MSHGSVALKEVGEYIWRAWCDFGAIARDFIAIDPGLRKCGFSRAFSDGSLGLRLTAALDEPLITTFAEGACAHANKITDVEASATGGNYVNWLLRDGATPLVLVENQPPSRVTGRAGRCTRAFANGLVSGFKARGCPVVLKTVRAYKNKAFGFQVHEDRMENKQASVSIIRLLWDWFPEFVEMEKELLKNADVADSLILLLSELVEVLPLDRLCKKLSLDYQISAIQKLHLLLMVLRVPHTHHLFQSYTNHHLELLRTNALETEFVKQSLAHSAEPRTSRLGSTRRKKIAGTPGVPTVVDTLANHSIMSRVSTSNPCPLNQDNSNTDSPSPSSKKDMI